MGSPLVHCLLASLSCPGTTAAVSIDEGADNEQLVQSKLACDTISLAPHPEVMTQWMLFCQ